MAIAENTRVLVYYIFIGTLISSYRVEKFIQMILFLDTPPSYQPLTHNKFKFYHNT